MPLVSVIIPTHNEGAGIAEAVNRLRHASSRFPVEIIIVDGASTDDTVAVAQGRGARVISALKPCRSRQMHLGAQIATGDLFVFLHADTSLPASWQEDVEQALIRPPNPPAAVAFRLAFDADTWFYRLMAQMAHWRNRLTGIPQGDQGLIVKRETYFAAGGFPDVPIMEEYVFLPKLAPWGRIQILRTCAMTSCRRYQRDGPLRTALHHTLLILLFYCGVPLRWLFRR